MPSGERRRCFSRRGRGGQPPLGAIGVDPDQVVIPQHDAERRAGPGHGRGIGRPDEPRRAVGGRDHVDAPPAVGVAPGFEVMGGVDPLADGRHVGQDGRLLAPAVGRRPEGLVVGERLARRAGRLLRLGRVAEGQQANHSGHARAGAPHIRPSHPSSSPDSPRALARDIELQTMSVQTYANFINGEWVPAASGETFENRSPADTSDLVGRFAASSSADVDAGRGLAAEAYATLAPGAGPEAGRDPAPGGAAVRRAQGPVRARHDPRDGQGRRPKRGGDVQEAIDMAQLHGRRGPPALRPDDAVRAAQQVRDVDPPAGRPVRADHRLEFPDGGAVVEDLPGPDLRQHRGAQAGRGSAALGRQLRADAGRRRPAGRRGQPRDRRWRRGRRAPGRPSRHPRRLVHRIDRDRPARERGGGAVVQEGPPRDGRQERDHRPGRRRPRAGGRRLPVGRLRHDRAAVHRGQPRHRPEGHLPPLPRALRRAGAGAEGRQRPRARRPDGAVDHRGAAAEGRRLRRHRPARGRHARDRRASPDQPATGPRAGSTSRRSSATCRRRCASPRRRSSGRSSR